MAETIMRGRLEDHLGRVLRPESEAKQILMDDGLSLEDKVAAMMALFSGYIPKQGGGDITGNLNITNGRMSISNWGAFSSGTDGHAMYAQNAYKDPVTNKYFYLQTHESMGAKGIVMRHGAPGIYWFDTGMIPTVKDQEFTPVFQRLDKPDAALVNGKDLNQITENGVYCGDKLSNAPGSDWYYVFVQNLTNSGNNYCVQRAFGVNDQEAWYRTLINGTWKPWEKFLSSAGGNVSGTLTVISDGGNGLQLVGTTHVYVPIYKNGISGGRSGYIGYPDGAATVLEINNEVSGGAVRLKAQGGVYINDQKIPAQFASTSYPDNGQGQDGDVWNVYV